MYLLVKAYYHFNCFVKKAFYKFIYGKRICFGKGVTFRKSVSIAPMGDGVINIGNNVFFNHNCSVYAMDSITIGDGTLFGENVKVYDHNHICKNQDIPIKEQGYSSGPICIGKHCWIASNVVILKGVTIGDNVIVGAGCIIYKDVPSNTTVVCKQELNFK